MRKIVTILLIATLSLSCFSAFACGGGETEIYSITYSVADGTLPDGAISEYSESDKDISLPTPTKAGYTFAGWKNGSDVITVIAAGTKGDLYLTAVFHAKFTVTIDNTTAASFTAWKDDSTGSKIVYVSIGDKLIIPAIKWDDFSETRKEAENYEFLGWFYRDKDNAERQFDPNAVFTLENLNLNTYNVTLYAKVTEVIWVGPF